MLQWMTPALCALTLVVVLVLLWMKGRGRDEQALRDLAEGLRRSAQAETERLEREVRDELSRHAQAARADLAGFQQAVLNQARGSREVLDLALKRFGDSLGEQLRALSADNERRLADVRAAHPEHFFLVPGVGAQGGDLRSVIEAGVTPDGALLINNSRGILYAGKDEDAIPAARRSAGQMQQVMENALRAKRVI